ncbi:hypothetical protein AAFF_G00393180 [Aldrovandia affinis]|uniref:Uncharacterized protein n=1 Tax=Aldrovandia affinis TaxID=143900 RepID=A0AAD7SDL3_9TELE|nr:hypothetical protein AAFF_G00393180 [Aldrovandia affinis]
MKGNRAATFGTFNAKLQSKVKLGQHQGAAGDNLNVQHGGWDSKLAPTLSSMSQLEARLTVVVGVAARLKLLGVPAYTKGTDEACGAIIARLTCKLLQEWRCADQVVNMPFDTTASNTGHLTAACIAIQLSLGRLLLWCGCRHHIGEVLLSHIFTDLKAETSCSPEVALFAHLRDNMVPHNNSAATEPGATQRQRPTVPLHSW